MISRTKWYIGLSILFYLSVILYAQYGQDQLNYKPAHLFSGTNDHLENFWRLPITERADMTNLMNLLMTFREENGSLPTSQNPGIVHALRGNNKMGKDYLKCWIDVPNNVLTDREGKPYVFNFINNNEITIYCSTTTQTLHGYLDTGTVVITQQQE